jgi:ADP-heptose:LPS heptosyltransferase
MLERFRNSVGLLGARIHFRKWNDDVLSFGGAVSEAHRLLLIMPLDGSPLYPVAPVVTMLKERKPEEAITVLVASHTTEALEALHQSPLIRILPGEISMFFCPHRNVIARVTQQTYDVAIDLNLDFHLPSGYICRESGARFRVGFVSKRSDLFYNFQIQTSQNESRMLRYERLAKCLEMF